MKYQFNTNNLKVINQATLIEVAEVETEYFLPFQNQSCESIEKAVYELLDCAATKGTEEESLIYLSKLINVLKEPYIIDIFAYNKKIEELNKLKKLIITEINDIAFNTSCDY